MMSFEAPPSPFVQLLREAFHERSDLPPNCSIEQAFEVNQSDLSDVIAIVDAGGGRDDLISRLRLTHPEGKEHHEGFDPHFWTVWTEAEAFAWAAEVANLGTPQFTDDHGKPDLLVPPGIWVEAKTIQNSPEEQRIIDAMVSASERGTILIRGPATLVPAHQNLLKKFRDHLDDAVRKLDRQECGRLVVFFSLTIDWPTNQQATIKDLRTWAASAASAGDCAIVICWRDDWQEPLVAANLVITTSE